MASRSGGIPGLSVGAAALGAFLIYMGIKNVAFLDGLRSLLKGTLPAGTPSKPTQVPADLTPGGIGGAIGEPAASVQGYAAIAEDAKKYLGTPYKWGGNTPQGWDCSGFCTWVLAHDLGYKLPSQTHTTAIQFLTMSEAFTVPRSQTQAGDLCCWGSHVGIAVDGTNFVNAPTFGIPTRIQPIYSGAVIRRMNYPPGGQGGVPAGLGGTVTSVFGG